MNARKVLEMGGGTLLVSLPKAWARKNGITKGSTVAVDELSGRKLLVRPIEEAAEKPREAEVEYPKEGLRLTVNDVTGAYLLGYDVIRILGKKVISREDRVALKTAIGRLIGLEIMDEDSKQITVQFLLEPSAIDPEKIVRRMSGIIEGMIKDTAEGVARGDGKLLSLVGERDDEVDRLYFLLVRTIRTAIMHQEVAERYGLAPVDILDYRVLASFLESTGDAMAELSKRLHSIRLQRQAAREYSACVLKLNEMEELAIQSFLGRGAGRSRSAYTRVGELSREVSSMLLKIAQAVGSSSSLAVETLGAVEGVSKLLVDISDLAVPMGALQSPSKVPGSL
ncbi:MAG: phosphate uptake regulator PhoU [Nitrososphaerales archaeon]|nr:phosphate uptake regulator PhoU [Nitrososphaerales archaeon]